MNAKVVAWRFLARRVGEGGRAPPKATGASQGGDLGPSAPFVGFYTSWRFGAEGGTGIYCKGFYSITARSKDVTWGPCRVSGVGVRALSGGEDRASGQVPISEPSSTRDPKQRSLESDCI